MLRNVEDRSEYYRQSAMSSLASSSSHKYRGGSDRKIRFFFLQSPTWSSAREPAEYSGKLTARDWCQSLDPNKRVNKHMNRTLHQTLSFRADQIHLQTVCIQQV